MFCTAWPQKFKQKPSVMLTICWKKGNITYLESVKYPEKMVKDGDHPNTLVKLYNFVQQGAVTFSFFIYVCQ
jgi:hypothetical protein